jgi:hypothetical protein
MHFVKPTHRNAGNITMVATRILKEGTPQPIFMKAIEIFGNQPPCLVDENETIDLTMCAIPEE